MKSCRILASEGIIVLAHNTIAKRAIASGAIDRYYRSSTPTIMRDTMHRFQIDLMGTRCKPIVRRVNISKYKGYPYMVEWLAKCLLLELKARKNIEFEFTPKYNYYRPKNRGFNRMRKIKQHYWDQIKFEMAVVNKESLSDKLYDNAKQLLTKRHNIDISELLRF